MADEPRKANGSGDVSPGDLLGAYVVERKLGSGGMAEVYFAVHQELSRPAALKVLRASLATDEVHLQRFMQEARAAAALIHPNIVQVYDVGRDGNLHYIAGEYIPGCNLREYLSESREKSQAKSFDIAGQVTEPEMLPRVTLASSENASHDQNDSAGPSIDPNAGVTHDTESSVPRSSRLGLHEQRRDRQLGIRETLSIALQVLAALDKSAKAGIVHRDIKPENIMLTPEGDAKVADFGLARVLLGDDPNLTRAGTTLGTPMYMSPEQIQDGEVDIRSDLYSLGVTLFHMLAGGPPFKGDTPLALAMQHVQAQPPPLSSLRADVPTSLAEIVHKLLAKLPNDRFASPGEVVAALQAARSGDLASFWPEQTVPLPGVRLEKQAGLYRETLVLAERLKANRLTKNRHLRWAFAVACVALAFALGFWGASQPPLLADAQDITSTKREDTARAQYEAALLSGSASLERAQAVVDYHADSEDEKYWVDLAKIQIAKLRQKSGSLAKAKQELRQVLQDPSIAPEHAMLARLLQADLESDRQRDQELQEAAALFLSLPPSQRDAKKFAPWVSQQTFENWQARIN